ncbi:MAG: feruloyl-CoA synthase [Hyphomicrobiales bacterium]|nr:feruloyl-CoA synthase [Hyphomicrobiales bacterium]
MSAVASARRRADRGPLLGPREVVLERRPHAVCLRSPHRLGRFPDKITERLELWAERTPRAVFLAERDAGGTGWRTLTYAEALAGVRGVGEALLQRDLSTERPIVILSGNDIEHASLGLAANYVGLPYAPISPAYSLVSRDHARLRHVMDLLTPGLLFVSEGPAFAAAVQAVAGQDVEVVPGCGGGLPSNTTPFNELLATRPTAAVDRAHAAVGPDTIAKFMFTSGSTDVPKAVIYTQRMWCSNQEMIRTSLPYFAHEPPVLVDWVPWHHTGGGNHDLGIALYNGGALYIDHGRPLPGEIETTVQNLRSIAPTWYFNVPKGFAALLPYLRDDEALRERFFSRVEVLFFAGASLAQHVADEIEELARTTRGERVPILTSLGATETGPLSIVRTWDADDVNNVGVPAVGVEVKLVPAGGKLEVRLRGPNITPGYWRRDDLTRKAFDEEGFYCMGDAVRWRDASDPAAGLIYDGRIAEDFKLSTGTWVNVEPLRAAVLAGLRPYVHDLVITGAGRDEIGALIFPDLDGCGKLVQGVEEEALIDHPQLRAELRRRLGELASRSTGSSTRVARALLVPEAASLDAGEITDKGTINQAAVLARRADLVAALYADPTGPRVIILD